MSACDLLYLYQLKAYLIFSLLGPYDWQCDYCSLDIFLLEL